MRFDLPGSASANGKLSAQAAGALSSEDKYQAPLPLADVPGLFRGVCFAANSHQVAWDPKPGAREKPADLCDAALNFSSVVASKTSGYAGWLPVFWLAWIGRSLRAAI